MSETVTGYIDHVIFRNEDNGYTVMVMKGTEDDSELTCVGTFPALTQGASIEAVGNYTTHPVYGRQFQISSYTEKMPEDALAMERYLGSGAIKGIGAALAARIVRRFGDDTMRIVEEEPERLAEIKGISEKKAMEIAEQMTEKADMRRAMIFLQKYGISLNLGARIYQKYGQTVYSVLQENPYRLAEDISGVGFKIADEIASRIGIHTDSDYRIRSGMLYTLLQASGEGHTYLPKEELFFRASQLLGVDPSYMEKHLMDMVVDRKLIVKETEEGAVVCGAVSACVEGAAVCGVVSGAFVVSAAVVESSTRTIVVFFFVSWITLSAVSARESRALVVDSFVSAPSVWFAADGGTVVVSAAVVVPSDAPCAEEADEELPL